MSLMCIDHYCKVLLLQKNKNEREIAEVANKKKMYSVAQKKENK